eukprot:TRINITY_DN12518_c0_g1_i2.p1 TRINITY_DN12518_c0_g1~~TRINITY_DN12518_c0_g1_i2.p1  ORF type:complete len:284 (+),score=19.41 TRINITY_DN12518_c0_g1_i2:65-853(+)
MVGRPIASRSLQGRGRYDESSPLRRGQPLASAEAAIRNAFVQKVYAILFAQLLVTTVLSAAVRHVALKWMHAGARNNISALLFVSLIGSVAVLCAVRCYPYLMRRYPSNYCLLLAFTVCKASLVGLICAAHTLDSVLVSVAITTVLALSLSIFACQTSYDFTGFGPYLFCGAMALFCFGLFFWIGGMLGLRGSPIFDVMHLVYAVCGALLFCCYLVFDTQQILGGKHQYQYSVDDYALGAINLYIDVVQLFLFLLRIVGTRR